MIIKNLLLFSVFFLFSLELHCQTVSPAIKFYDEAVSYFNHQNYRKADSLYTLSGNIEPHKDTYYSRAICRLKMGNKAGYCMDLSNASDLGDAESYMLFWKNCIKSDSVYLDSRNKICKTNAWVYKQVKHKCEYTKYTKVLKYNKENKIIKLYDVIANTDTIYTIADSSAQYPNGLNALKMHIQFNLIYPETARDKGISGKVFIRFIVNKAGSIKDITVLRGVEGCKECDLEAARVIKSMPPWKPAMVNGKKVNSYINIPISFKIIK